MLEKGVLSGSELMFLTFGFVMGTSLLLSPGLLAQQQAWQTVLAGMLEGGIFVWLFTALALRFPGKTAIEICEMVFGPVLGKALAAGYLLYIFHLGSLVIRNMMDFIKLTILEDTPVDVILLVFLLVCVYAVRSGLEILGRCSQALGILTMFLVLIITVLLFPQFNLQHYFPLFGMPLSKLMTAAHQAAMFPFGETVVFMMLVPYIAVKKELRKWMFRGYVMGGLLLVLVTVRNVGVLGKTMGFVIYPSYYVAKLIEIADVLTRMEILVALNSLTMGFLKTGILLYGSALGMAQLLKLTRYAMLVFPLGVLMVVLALFDFDNVIESIEFVQKVYPLYAPVFCGLFPFVTLLFAWIRHLPREEGSE